MSQTSLPPAKAARKTASRFVTPEPMPAEAEGPRDGRPHTAAQQCVTLRVMAYNIEFGWRWPQNRDLILANPVDVLCLQEVPEPAHPDRKMIRPQQIVDDLDRPHDCIMLWDRAPKRVGNMTLVKPGGRLGTRQILHKPPAQPYGVAHEVEIRGARFTVANIHMDGMGGSPLLTFAPTELNRLRETLDLSQRYRRHPGPVIALGDFNSFWPAPAYCATGQDWTDCRPAVPGRHPSTRPTYGLPFVIDRILVRGGIVVRDYTVLKGGGSDHRAVLATLDVPIEP